MVEIVVEYSFVVSFIACYLALLCVSKTLNQSCDKLALSSLFGAIVSVFAPLLQNWWQLKVILVLLCMVFAILTSFRWQGVKNFFVEKVLLAGYICLFGGLCVGMQNLIGQFSLFVVCMILFVGFLVAKSVIKNISLSRKISSFSYKLKIVDDGREIVEEGYLDSGNVLTDKVSGKPVVLINFDVFHKLYEKVSFASAITKSYDQNTFKNGHFLSINSVGGMGDILVFSVDELWVGKNRFFKDATLGLSFSGFEKSFGKNVLLNAAVI